MMKAPGGKTADSRKFMAKLVPIGKRLPAYIKLSWALAFEPSIPWAHRFWLYATVVYILSPAHFAMNVVPILGQIDWILLLMFSIRQAINHCPPRILERHYERVKMSPNQLAADIKVLTDICREGSNAACATIEKKAPVVRRIGGNMAFAGRVANVFGRRVIHRLRNEPV